MPTAANEQGCPCVNQITVHLQVMDNHLSLLAKQHVETRFVKINAEKSPFLAEKLKIIVLPTLALIKNAKVDDYVGESSLHHARSSVQTKRSVQQSSKANSSDLE